MTVPKDQRAPDVWLYKKDDLQLLCPTSDDAWNHLFHGGFPLEKLTRAETIEDAWQSLPTVKATDPTDQWMDKLIRV